MGDWISLLQQHFFQHINLCKFNITNKLLIIKDMYKQDSTYSNVFKIFQQYGFGFHKFFRLRLHIPKWFCVGVVFVDISGACLHYSVKIEMTFRKVNTKSSKYKNYSLFWLSFYVCLGLLLDCLVIPAKVETEKYKS